MKRIIAFAIAVSALLVGSAMAQEARWGQNTTSASAASVSSQIDDCTSIISGLPMEYVSDTEKANLLHIREEEKLAKDLYLSFYQKWRKQIFGNIARSEQKHENAIKALLVKYGISDPAADNSAGVFRNPDLQKIYNDLLALGNSSLSNSLKVGATVEELDISDLETAIAEADSKDIQIVYQNLMKGSRNHLRNYIRMLKLYGQNYEPQYLTEEEVTEITDSPMERGVYDENGNPVF